MVTKEQKQQQLADLTELLRDAKGIYFADYSGMSVVAVDAMRAALKKKGFAYRVGKNTLIRRALADVGGYESIPSDKFEGMTGLVVSYDDPITPAKILRDISEKTQKPKVKVAIIEREVFDGSQLKQVAELPTREEIISSILGALDAPVSGIVGSINAVMRDLAGVIEAVAKKREGVE